MATYSIDGVPLDHPQLCWYLRKGTRRRPLPGARSVAVSVPGRSGVLPITDVDLEPTDISLVLAVTSRDAVGSNGGFGQLEANLEAISALLGRRDDVLDVRYTYGSSERQADATVVAVSEPEIWVSGAHAELTVVLNIPGTFWRDVDTADWLGDPDNVAAQEVTTLAGSTGPVLDALVRIEGPATDPIVADDATGSLFTYDGTVADANWLVVDCGQMQAAIVATDTWDLDTGTSATGSIFPEGPRSGFRWLALHPVIASGDPHDRRVKIVATATGTDAGSKIQIRARRSYL